jgi:threonine dehydrogenase-like Zn-dependent dehydrogenase
VIPTAWQAVEYAAVPAGGSLLVIGLGPIGDMSCRVARQRGVERIFGIDPVPERRARAAAYGIEVFDFGEDGQHAITEATEGRGPDSVIDAVGMEAHGSPLASFAHAMTGLLPAIVAEPMMEKAGVDRLAALYLAIELVRRGGTISIIGLYGGAIDPMPMLTLFDKQIQLRMGQANVRRWVDDIMPLLVDEADPLGTESFATHRLPLTEAPHAYAMFQKKEDGAVKVVFQP